MLTGENILHKKGTGMQGPPGFRVHGAQGRVGADCSGGCGLGSHVRASSPLTCSKRVAAALAVSEKEQGMPKRGMGGQGRGRGEKGRAHASSQDSKGGQGKAVFL